MEIHGPGRIILYDVFVPFRAAHEIMVCPHPPPLEGGGHVLRPLLRHFSMRIRRDCTIAPDHIQRRKVGVEKTHHMYDHRNRHALCNGAIRPFRAEALYDVRPEILDDAKQLRLCALPALVTENDLIDICVYGIIGGHASDRFGLPFIFRRKYHSQMNLIGKMICQGPLKRSGQTERLITMEHRRIH